MSIKSMIMKVRYLPADIQNAVTFQRKHVKKGDGVSVKGAIFITGRGRITLGDHVRINSCLAANPIGGDTRTVLNTFTDGEITVGDFSGLSNCALSARERIRIGKHVMIGGGTQIFDNDFHSLDYENRASEKDDGIRTEPVIIEDGAFIGARAIILKGVTIGKNSVVGAGAVVSRDVPDGEIWAGNPARFIKKVPGGEKTESVKSSTVFMYPPAAQVYEDARKKEVCET